jgi:hypothetical protein
MLAKKNMAGKISSSGIYISFKSGGGLPRRSVPPIVPVSEENLQEATGSTFYIRPSPIGLTLRIRGTKECLE